MKNKNILQIHPNFGKEEIRAIVKYLKSGGWITEFKKTIEFEKSIISFTSSKNCIVVNNGTISLSLAALACGLNVGDDVIVPNYTMIATPNSIKMLGANPIFVDVEEETLCLNLEIVKKKLTKKTKGIILVSPNGRYPKSGIKAYENFCKKNKLFLIEDAAQALGSFYPDGRHIGLAGDVGSFSFSMAKIVSTGQGGALITENNIIANKLRKLKDFGRKIGGNDIHDVIGFNSKFTDLQAIIGIEQMKKLNSRIISKKKIYKNYVSNLSGLRNVKLFENNIKYTTPWFIDILVEKRNDLILFLKKNKINTRVMYSPINKQKAYKVKGEFPISSLVGKKGLWLPSSPTLKINEVQYICDKIKEFYNQ